MGLFSKIFARKNQSPTHDPASRAPRVTLAPLHHLYFDLCSPISCSKLTIANISTTGIGFFKGKVENWPTSNGTLLSGTLHFQEQAADIQLKIVHINSEVVGCCFTSLPANFENTLSRYFQIELSAMQLDKIAKQYLKEESDGESHWFRGPNNCELFMVVAENSVLRFTISFFGNLLEYRAKKTVRYSRMNQEEENRAKMKGSELISHETTVPREIGESSIKFIMNIKELAAKHRDFICNIITQAIHTESEKIDH